MTLTDDYFAPYKAEFTKADTDNSGEVDKAELEKYLKNGALNFAQIKTEEEWSQSQERHACANLLWINH